MKRMSDFKKNSDLLQPPSLNILHCKVTFDLTAWELLQLSTMNRLSNKGRVSPPNTLYVQHVIPPTLWAIFRIPFYCSDTPLVCSLNREDCPFLMMKSHHVWLVLQLVYTGMMPGSIPPIFWGISSSIYVMCSAWKYSSQSSIFGSNTQCLYIPVAAQNDKIQ